VVVLAGGAIYHDRRWLGGRLHGGVGWVRDKAGRAAGAVLDAGRSVASALNPF
jgi:methyl coenzyme M reductase alpha subunit